MSNTTKPGFMGPMNGYLLERIAQMAAAVQGGAEKLRQRPLVTFVTCPVSPLKLIRDCCEIIMGAARHGLGVNILSMAMAGGSSPVTLAGTLVTHNAEVLTGITLDQLTQEGLAGRLRQLDHGDGPAFRGRLGGLAGVRADRRRRRPDWRASTCSRAGSPVRRGTPKRSMPRAGTRRP